MKYSKVLILVALLLLVCSAFAEEASKEQTKEVAQPETTGDEPKQTNQGGYCRQGQYCCGGYWGGQCRRYCCRGATATEAGPTENIENGGNFVGQGGGYGGGGKGGSYGGGGKDGYCGCCGKKWCKCC